MGFKINRVKSLLAAALLVSSPVRASQFDLLVLLDHPSHIDKNGSFTVGAVNLVNLFSLSGAPNESIERDSLHFGLGIPADWNVISVTIHPAYGFRPSRASVNRLDTNYRNQLLVDSLRAYQEKGTSLAADPGLAPFVAGKTFRVHASPDSLGKVLVTKADSVPQWVGFSGPLNLSIPSGEPVDTVFSGGASLTQIPIFIYVTLQSGGPEQISRPIYLSKTGVLDTVSQPGLGYCPVTVASPVSIGSRPLPSLSRGQASASGRDALGRGFAGRRPFAGAHILIREDGSAALDIPFLSAP